MRLAATQVPGFRSLHFEYAPCQWGWRCAVSRLAAEWPVRLCEQHDISWTRNARDEEGIKTLATQPRARRVGGVLHFGQAVACEMVVENRQELSGDHEWLPSFLARSFSTSSMIDW